MADSDHKALLLTIQANIELLRSNVAAAERLVDEGTKGIQAHLDETDRKFELFGHSLEKLEGPLERLKSLGEVAVGALLGESLIEAGKKGLEFAGNVKFVSEQVGASTDFLQKFRFAAGQFGVATSDADEGLGKFSRSIGEAANGNKSLIELFDRLGVKIRDSGGNVRSVQSVYLDTAGAIKQLDNPAQKAADTMALLGKQSVALVPLLSSGADGFNELAKAAEQLGVVLSPELIDHSEEVNHKLAALKQIVDAQLSSAIAQNAASIEVLASSFVKLAGGIAQFLSGHPDRALTILGALAGSRVGGLPGAAIGALAGHFAGSAIEQQDEEQSTDLTVRRKALRDAARAYQAAHATSASESDYAAERGGGPVSDPRLDEEAARQEYRRQRALYQAALHAPKLNEEGGLGSDGAGVTNNNGDELKKAQADLATLEQSAKGKSGAVLAAYNEQIAAKKRQIAFIKQGADAEMASSLAAKQDSIQRKGEAAAKEAQRKAEELRQKNLEADISFAGEQQKLRRQLLDGMGKSAANDNLRDQLQREEINAQADTLRQQYQARFAKGELGTDPKVAAARLETLIGTKDQPGGLVEKVRNQSLSNVTTARLSQNLQDQLDAANLDLQGKVTMAGLQERLALTAKERLKIDLQLLDYQEQLARNAARRVIDDTSGKYSDADKANAQTQLNQISAQHALAVAGIQQQNASPIDAYKRQLAASTGDMGEALDGVGADGLKDVEDGLVGITTQAETAKQALHSMIMSLLTDLEKLAIEKAFSALLGGGTGASSSGGGGFLKSLLNLFGGGGSSWSAATSNSIGGGADLTMDTSGFDFSSAIDSFADGGHFRGAGTGRSDSNLARVSDGEFIVNAAATKRNLAVLHAINDNKLPAFADGGLVGPSTMIAPRIPDMSQIGQSRMAAQAQAVKVALQIEPSDMFNVRAKQSAHDAIDERKSELVGASVAATQDASARRLINVRTR